MEITAAGDNEFQVRIVDNSSETRHAVSLNPDDYRRLTNGRITPEQLIRRSFEFLLEREPKEAILKRFDLRVIGDYFPEFENEIWGSDVAAPSK